MKHSTPRQHDNQTGTHHTKAKQARAHTLFDFNFHARVELATARMTLTKACFNKAACCWQALAITPSMEESPPSLDGVAAGEGGGWPGGRRQIVATRAESQWIVAARPLYHLQYPVASKSSTEDLPQ
jgi:hypothetical protein